MNKTVEKVLRTEYALLRTPLSVLDERVLTRLGPDSKLRAEFERGLEMLDTTVDRLLHTTSGSSAPPEAAGTESLESLDAVDDDGLDALDEDAAHTLGAEPAEAEPIEPDAVEQLAEELLEEQEQHTLTGELAEDEELRRVQAELRAKHQMEEQRDSDH